MARNTPPDQRTRAALHRLSTTRWVPSTDTRSTEDGDAQDTGLWAELARDLAWHFAASYEGLPTHAKQQALASALGAEGGWREAYKQLRALSSHWDRLTPMPMADRATATRLAAELNDTRRKLSSAEARIRELDQALMEASTNAREDHLTGALNRRGLAETFDSESAVARRYRQPLTLALLDMDDFKCVNDQRGHDVGDAALVHFAHTVKCALRPSDRFARLGGEEFLVLLPRTGATLAAETMQRLQRALAPPFFTAGGPPLLLTFSAGVTEYRAGESQEDAISRADKALYEAKQSGKNRVVST